MRSRLILILSLAMTGAVIAVAYSAADTSASAKIKVAGSPLATPTPKRLESNKAKHEKLVFISDWDGTKIDRTEAEWKNSLTDLEFYILRKSGTEQPYTGAFTDNKQHGSYYCAACGLSLFSSKAKFDSGTGWPSFYESINKTHVIEKEDKSLGEVRTEVLCARCGSHQGHVFDDGPEPTGLRYCINSAALKFSKSK